MKKSIKGSLFLILLMPLQLLAAQLSLDGLSMVVQVISVLNTVLLFTSVLSIFRFFWPGYQSRFTLHVLNAIFVILFYSLSLTFLVSHKNFFDGYETLSDMDCVKKYFLSADLYSIIKKLIPVAFVLNLIYISRHRRTFYLES